MGWMGRLVSPTSPDTNWQGLAELSSVNDNTDEYRHNPRLSLEDWTSYLKAVDRTFALLNSHSEQNKANGTPTVPSIGFPVASAELLVSAEMASAESGEDPSHMVGKHLLDLASQPPNPAFEQTNKLGLQSHRRLQPISQHHRECPQDVEPEEDAFEDQLHPHAHSDKTSAHQVSNVSNVEQPIHPNRTERLLAKMQKNGLKEWVPNLEGSASSQLLSD
ncbi:hypothetical protein STEG23_022199 [Scotinomys teguina]